MTIRRTCNTIYHMENIHIWQYIVIAGPAFVMGAALAAKLLYKKKRKYTRRKIADKVMQGVAADAVYGRDE